MRKRFFYLSALFAVSILALYVCYSFIFNDVKASAETVINIPNGNITDHGDANTRGSIAWYFKTNGSGKTYTLTDSNYSISHTLTVPENSKFDGLNSAKIVASSALDARSMVLLTNSSIMQNMEIDGNMESSSLVNAGNSNYVTIDNCKIHNSKNDFTTEHSYTMLIICSNSKNIVVKNCTLYNAGYVPNNDSLKPKISVNGTAIIAWRNYNAHFYNNTISNTLTCGIALTGSSNVEISYNKISDTGKNSLYGFEIADGITSYHNWNTTDDEIYNIHHNNITNSSNHGIHVSGRNIRIENNTLGNYYASGIMVDDWRNYILTGAGYYEFSENVIVKNNKFSSDPLCWKELTSGNSNRKIYINKVNNLSGFNLDYKNNLDVDGKSLPVNSDNYKFPTNFGPHEFIPMSKATGGNNFNAVIKSDGTVWTTGGNGNSSTDFGELGYRTSSADGKMKNQLTFKSIDNLSGILAIKSQKSGYNAIALKNDGTAWVWGRGISGQFGNGSTDTCYNFTPTKYSKKSIKDVAMGGNFSLVAATDGTVWGAGATTSKQLGDKTATVISTPSQVTGFVSSIKNVAAGLYHSVALDTSGKVWTWGFGGYGQLGNSSTLKLASVDLSSTTCMYLSKNCISKPTAVNLTGTVAAIAANANNTYMLASDGTVWGCGRNNYGQLGDGTTTDRYDPVKVDIKDTDTNPVIDISAGEYSLMLLRNNGTVWICGYNQYGALGPAAESINQYLKTPKQVPNLSNIVSISAGYANGMAISGDGTVYTWGLGHCGQLGDGCSNDTKSATYYSSKIRTVIKP